MESETKALIFLTNGSFPFVLPISKAADADFVNRVVGEYTTITDDFRKAGHPRDGDLVVVTADLDEVQDLFDGKGVPDSWPPSVTGVTLPFYGDLREFFTQLTTHLKLTIR